MRFEDGFWDRENLTESWKIFESGKFYAGCNDLSRNSSIQKSSEYHELLRLLLRL